MIDDKKIEDAALSYCAKCSDITNRNVDLDKDWCVDLHNGFIDGAKWVINEDLCHSIEEEPKHDKQITYVWGNGIAKTIILNEEADKFNRTPSQIWHNICKNYKVVSWLYIDDLLPKKGGKQ